MATVIFDFDGTLADSFEVIADIFYELTGRSEKLTPRHIHELRGMSALQVAERLRVPWWKIPFLVSKGRRAMQVHMSEIKPFVGIPELVRDLHGAGHRLLVVSSNSRRNCLAFLREYQLGQYFGGTYGNIRLFGKGRFLRHLIERKRLNSGDCFYVGDETRDEEAAHEAGLRCIAVTWGFAERQLLLDNEPFAHADKPTDILKIISSA